MLLNWVLNGFDATAGDEYRSVELLPLVCAYEWCCPWPCRSLVVMMMRMVEKYRFISLKRQIVWSTQKAPNVACYVWLIGPIITGDTHNKPPPPIFVICLAINRGLRNYYEPKKNTVIAAATLPMINCAFHFNIMAHVIYHWVIRKMETFSFQLASY